MFESNYQYGADYWNNKYPSSPVIYSGRSPRVKSDSFGIDVTEFMTTHDAILNQIIKDYNLVKSTANDTALAIQKWVVSFLTYVDDAKGDGVPEYWQFPFETVQQGAGDCEDGAILTANLLLNAGIPAWRVKVGAGYVQESPTAPQGGHAYCLYLSDCPSEDKKLAWRILDWCYYEDSAISMDQKPLAKNGGYKGCYKDVWFTFNSENAWAAEELTVPEGRISQGQTSLKESVIRTNASTISTIMNNIARRIKNKR